MKIFSYIGFFKKLPLPFFRNGAKKTYDNTNIYNKISLLQNSITQLDSRINSMQEYISKIHSEMENRFTIDKYIVERMNVDKFELKLEAINVKELGGALNVGIIHNSVVHEGRSTPDVNSTCQNSKQLRDICDYGEKKCTMTFYPGGTIPANRPKPG